MTNKELMMRIAEVRRVLFATPFAGTQMMVVSDCIRILDDTLSKLNVGAGNDAPREEATNVLQTKKDSA